MTSQVKHVTSVSSVTLNSCQERPERPWHPPYFSPQPPPPPIPLLTRGLDVGESDGTERTEFRCVVPITSEPG